MGELDGDGTVEARVAGFPPLTHTARADGRKQFVRANSVAGTEHAFDDSVELAAATAGGLVPRDAGRVVCVFRVWRRVIAGGGEWESGGRVTG